MLRKLFLGPILGAVCLILGTANAWAVNCSANPFTLAAGQVASATQVMANFNNLLNCANTILGTFSGPSSSVSGNAVTFSGTDGKTGQDSGVALNNLAWTSYVPVMTCTGGSPAGNPQGAYVQIGKTVIVEGNVTVTAGTCTGSLFLTVPLIHASSPAPGGVCSGHYLPNGGGPSLALAGLPVADTHINMLKYDGSFPAFVVGDKWTFSCAYQTG